MKRLKKKFDRGKEVRAIARERVGPVKASKTIVPKTAKKPKKADDADLIEFLKM